MDLFNNVITYCESGKHGAHLFSFYSPGTFLFHLLYLYYVIVETIIPAQQHGFKVLEYKGYILITGCSHLTLVFRNGTCIYLSCCGKIYTIACWMTGIDYCGVAILRINYPKENVYPGLIENLKCQLAWCWDWNDLKWICQNNGCWCNGEVIVLRM